MELISKLIGKEIITKVKPTIEQLGICNAMKISIKTYRGYYNQDLQKIIEMVNDRGKDVPVMYERPSTLRRILNYI